ncbi:MAG: DeoR/GlpR transcriptional regulator [Alphaproteobacteria bacterium]|nr:DeoR/GlpR transcriptional regulator [Alphaproteobacteria bacterium]
MARNQHIPAARRQRVQRQILIDGAVSVDQLARTLEVSLATVRRDLAWLDAQGLVRRTHGGAVIEAPRGADQDFAQREQIDAAEKRAMAEAVVASLEPDATVFMNDGSTLLAVARAIVARNLRLTVVTPAVNIATLLAEGRAAAVFLLGGSLRHRSLGTSGPFAETMVRSFNADLALLSAEGLSAEAGLTYSYEADASLARLMAERTRRTIALMTARKLGTRDRIAGLEAARIDDVITGCHDEACLASLRRLGVAIKVVGGSVDVAPSPAA